MEEAARVAVCSSQLDSADTTQALLKTFAWVEPPEEDTFCLVPAKTPHHKGSQQLGNKVYANNQPAIEIIPGMMQLNCCSFCVLFTIIYL